MNALFARLRTPVILLILLVVIVGLSAPSAIARSRTPAVVSDGTQIRTEALSQFPSVVSGEIPPLAESAAEPVPLSRPLLAEESNAETESAQETESEGDTPPSDLSPFNATQYDAGIEPPVLTTLEDDVDDDVDLGEAKQGVVTLTVDIVPNRFRAGDPITYTYRYRNTNTSDFARGIAMDVTWTDFASEVERDWQFCNPSPCLVITDSVRGPPVTLEGDIPGGIRLIVGDLAPGESGQFSVLIDTLNSILPQTGLAPSRVAGSASLYLNGEEIPTSENTADALAVGPVFTISKARFPDTTPQVIYPVETGDFIITLGNATKEVDKGRADAIDATNLIVVDTLPLGSAFISPTEYVSPTSTTPISFTFNPEEETVIWQIPRLRVGELITIPVRFQKLDVNTDCPNLRNNSYNVTSDEMPLESESQTRPGKEPKLLTVKGAGVGVRVQVPLEVSSIVSSPPVVEIGQTAEVQIRVRNYYTQTMDNLLLVYDIPSYTSYVNGSAAPTPTSVSETGRITWTFTISRAEDITTPTELTFRLTLNALQARGSSGVAQVVAAKALPPAPDACLRARAGGPRVQGPQPPRLVVTKTTNAGTGKPVFVQHGQTIAYTIKIENLSDVTIEGVEVRDKLPQGGFADFRYEPGTAIPPESEFQESQRTLIWREVSIPPGEPAEFTYQVQLEGEEYTDYCNTVTVIPAQEDVQVNNADPVCVKINPQVELIKEVNVSAALPGDQVIFTLSLINRENETLRIGLLDSPDKFQFEKPNPAMDTEYNKPKYNAETGLIEWPVVDVEPGGRLDGSFIARLPTGTACSGKLVNTALFSFFSARTQRTLRVTFIPPITAQVECIQQTIQYDQGASELTAGLGSKFIYALRVQNLNTITPTTGLTVEHVIPPGFSYLDPEEKSNVSTRPIQIPDVRTGRTRLIWTGLSILPGRSLIIRYFARSGAVVGPKESWLVASAPGVYGKCIRNCRVIQEGEELTNYATNLLNIKALVTLEPKILESATCFDEGKEITMTYRLSLLTTDSDNNYPNTSVAITVPIGLRYQTVLSNTAVPIISASSMGQTILTWPGVTIPKVPKNKSYQMDFFVAFEVGNVFQRLSTHASAAHPEVIIPLKERTENPTVRICVDPNAAPAPLIGKEVSPPFVVPGGDLFYQVQFSNIHNQSFTVDFEDRLSQVTGVPNAFTFVRVVTETSDVLGNPTQPNPQTLRWTGISIPPGSPTDPSIVTIVYKVKVDSKTTIGSYASTARMTRVTPAPSGTYRTESTASVNVVPEVQAIYLPAVRK